VTISEYPGVPGSDYINANYVKGSTGSTCAYIASQGPLPNTVVDYWRMIWECEVTLIIMACNERESGKYKCEVYWPQTSDEEHQYGNITGKLHGRTVDLDVSSFTTFHRSETGQVATSMP